MPATTVGRSPAILPSMDLVPGSGDSSLSPTSTSAPGGVPATVRGRPDATRTARPAWLVRLAVRLRDAPPAAWQELALVGLFVFLRSWNQAPIVMAIWYGGAAVLALMRPVSGVVVLAAISPWREGEIGSVKGLLFGKDIVLFALALGVSGRWLRERIARELASATTASRSAALAWLRQNHVYLLAFLLLAGTLLGVIVGYFEFPLAFARVSATDWWHGGLGGSMAILLAAAWVARRGERRALAVAIGASMLAIVVTLVASQDAELIRSGPFDWLLRPAETARRSTGVINGANSVAVMALMLVSLLGAYVAFGRDRRLRAVAAVVAVIPFLVMYFTYSRSALLSLGVISVVFAWRYRRVFGIAALVAAVAVGVVVGPRFVEARNVNAPAGDQGFEQFLNRGDTGRFRAWGAAVRMTIDAPLTGHGYRSFEALHQEYGEPELPNPHNEWLRLFAEEGIIVGTIGIAFVLAVLAALWRGRGWLVNGVLGAWMGFVILASFNNPFNLEQLTLPFFMILGSGLALGALGRRPVVVDTLLVDGTDLTRPPDPGRSPRAPVDPEPATARTVDPEPAPARPVDPQPAAAQPVDPGPAPEA